MKKFLLLGLTLVLLFGCKQNERFATSSANIEEVKALLADYNSGNWEGWLSHYGDSATLYHNTWEKGVSPQEMGEALKGILANTSSYGFPEKDGNGEDNIFFEEILNDEGQTWVYFWGDWMGTLAANGEKLEIPVHLALRMENNKIVREFAFYNLSEYTAAMQAIEKANNMPIDDKVIQAQGDKFVSEFLNKQDASVLKDILAENFVRYVNDVKDSNNADELVARMNVFFTGFPDFKIERLHESPIFNNTRFIHWQMTGTNSGEFNGAPATGKKIKVSGLTRIHFNGDGKMDEQNVFYNQLDLMQQLGKTLN